MNKKIYKGYELAEAVDNGILNLEQKVKSADDMTYFDCTIDFLLKDVAKNIMFKEFEILEDNTEEIEEYKGESFEQLGYEIGKMSTAIVRGLIKAVNEMKEESEDKQ